MPIQREPTPIEYLGDKNYRLRGQALVLEDFEDATLRPFFKEVKRQPKWAALDKRQLIEKSGYETAPRILKGMLRKHSLLIG